ncbi:hypothetical protein RRG08_022438 [Elysia crispata]|uniref:Uncharacterized protein n=1 Tax=Elysia crispata TaxID=231223 RepID=A0AAE0Z1H9_9GAST|nr:hypothetical protein RRG08_022438 [Elysia crispata]
MNILRRSGIACYTCNNLKLYIFVTEKISVSTSKGEGSKQQPIREACESWNSSGTQWSTIPIAKSVAEPFMEIDTSRHLWCLYQFLIASTLSSRMSDSQDNGCGENPRPAALISSTVPRIKFERNLAPSGNSSVISWCQ